MLPINLVLPALTPAPAPASITANGPAGVLDALLLQPAVGMPPVSTQPDAPAETSADPAALLALLMDGLLVTPASAPLPTAAMPSLTASVVNGSTSGGTPMMSPPPASLSPLVESPVGPTTMLATPLATHNGLTPATPHRVPAAQPLSHPIAMPLFTGALPIGTAPLAARPATVAAATATIPVPAQPATASPDSVMAAPVTPSLTLRHHTQALALSQQVGEALRVESSEASTLLTPSTLAQATLRELQSGDAPVIKLPGLPEQQAEALREALGERLQMQIDQRTQKATIRLDPPNMGKLDLSLHFEGGKLQVHIQASQPDVLRALQQTSHELRTSLSEQNHVPVNVQVSQQSGDQRQPSRHPQQPPATPTRVLQADERHDDARRSDSSILKVV